MQNFRVYGNKPYRIAVIHGGPGAPGEMAPVARELSSDYGVIEPLQTEDSVPGQVEELRRVLEQNADFPVILIGHSWGAWLSFIFTAEDPSRVAKLILVSSGPFEEKYAASIIETRLSRLSKEEQSEVVRLTIAVTDPESSNKDDALSRFGELMSKADQYNPIAQKSEAIWTQADIYEKVWPQAAELRRSGKLLAFAEKITCPVIAIHGDYDPHPWQGVKEPLSPVLKDFKFILLQKCGHQPWNELAAKDKFYHILREEIDQTMQ